MNFKNTRSAFASALLCCSFLLIQACASIDPDYEQPTVTLSSFKALPSEGGMPTFEIGLHILNPNSSPFRLEGIVYTISVQGHDVVKGVGKDFPVLEGYSEQTVKLTATANLLAGIRLVMDMMNTPADELQYEFEAKLDTWRLWPLDQGERKRFIPYERQGHRQRYQRRRPGRPDNLNLNGT